MNFVFMFWALTFVTLCLSVTFGSLTYNFYDKSDDAWKVFGKYTVWVSIAFVLTLSVAALLS